MGPAWNDLTICCPPGLDEHEHIRLACSMTSRFAVGSVVDPDLDIAAWALGVWGPLLPRWQESVRKVLHRLVKAFDPVEQFLMSLSPPAYLRDLPWLWLCSLFSWIGLM